MGASQSSTSGAGNSNCPYLQYTNDYELVMRATKDLEHLLETKFGATRSKIASTATTTNSNNKLEALPDMITYVQNTSGLSSITVKRMRHMVTLRNRLVHEVGFHAIPDRSDFAYSHDQIMAELKAKLAEQRKKKLEASVPAEAVEGQQDNNSSNVCVIS